MNNSPNNFQSTEVFLKTITIIHLALLVSQVLFAVVVYTKIPHKIVSLQAAGDVYFYLVPCFAIVAAVIGTYVYRPRIAALAEKGSLQEKLMGYQSALIIRWAISNGPSLFATVVFLLTSNVFYLFVAGLNILYFIWLRPTKERIDEELNLGFGD